MLLLLSLPFTALFPPGCKEHHGTTAVLRDLRTALRQSPSEHPSLLPRCSSLLSRKGVLRTNEELQVKIQMSEQQKLNFSSFLWCAQAQAALLQTGLRIFWAWLWTPPVRQSSAVVHSQMFLFLLLVVVKKLWRKPLLKRWQRIGALVQTRGTACWFVTGFGSLHWTGSCHPCPHPWTTLY